MGCLVTAHVTRDVPKRCVDPLHSLPISRSTQSRDLAPVESVKMVKRELSASDDEDELLLKSIPGPGFEPLSGVKQERARQTKATLIAAHDDTVVGTNGQIDLAVGKRGKAVEGVKKPKPEKAVKSVRDHPMSNTPSSPHHMYLGSKFRADNPEMDP